MKKSKFSESQIVNILKEADAGVCIATRRRKQRIKKSSRSYRNWQKSASLGLRQPDRLSEASGLCLEP